MTLLQNAIPPSETGLSGIGLATYHNQHKRSKNIFAVSINTLPQQNTGYIAKIADTSLVHNAEKAFKARHKFNTTELYLLYGTTLAHSASVIPMAEYTGIPAFI